MKLDRYFLDRRRFESRQRFFDRMGFQLVDYRPPCGDIKDPGLCRPMIVAHYSNLKN